jgi:hypothetical protein
MTSHAPSESATPATTIWHRPIVSALSLRETLFGSGSGLDDGQESVGPS